MNTLLLLECSPRGDESITRRAAREIVAGLRQRTAWEVDTLDLWTESLPAMDRTAAAAKYAVFQGLPLAPEQETAWGRITECVERFCRADAVLIAAPMWNFGVPYVLKHYIDVITQPRLTFAWTPTEGYRSLLPERPAIVLTSSGGDYSEESGQARDDFHRPYLKRWLELYMGCRVSLLTLAPTVGEPSAVQGLFDRAVAEGKALLQSV